MKTAKHKHAGYAGYVARRKNPLTGDWNVVLDCKRAEEEGNAVVADWREEGGRYQVICDKHGSVVHCETRTNAVTCADDGTNFCDECRELESGRKAGGLGEKGGPSEKRPNRDAATMVGRLTPGSGYGGPEFSGCCNTGQRPVIRRPKTSGGVPSLYLVGPQYECETVLQTQAGRSWYLSNGGRRSIGEGNKRVWKFKGRAAAIAKFQELCDRVWAFNDKAREDRAAAVAKANSADPATRMQGALDLLDH